MMKKFTKAALLLAAAALLLAGLPACSGDDDDDVAVEGVTLNPTELTMTAGEQVKLTATVLPEGADNKEVLWASDNEGAATVDETGLVTAVGTGTATITVTTEDGGYTAACVVTVSDGTGNGGNGGGGGNGNFSTKTDDTTANNVATLGLVGTSADSSNQSVATAKIEGNKIVITSHSAGTAVITVKDGDKKATIPVTVAADGTITIGTITKYEPMLSGGELSYTLFKLDDLSSGVSLSDGKLSDELTALGITLAGGKLDSAQVAAVENPSTSAFNGDALSLANYVGTQGAIDKNNCLKIVATADMTVYVYARSSGGTDERFLALYSATSSNNSFDENTKQGIGSSEGAVLGVAKFKITKGETKYIGSTGSGINIYAIGVITGGEPDEMTTQTVSVTPATCTESGIKAHTVTNFGRYLCGGSYVPYSGVIAPALGHDYANTTGTVSTMPTADAKGSYTATCKRDSHTGTFELPALNSSKYKRTASGTQTSYTYKDAETECTVTFTADTVEEDQNAAESWSLDFTNASKQPTAVDSEGSAVTGDIKQTGIVIGGLLTVTAVDNKISINSKGYISINPTTSITISFEAKAAGTLTLKYNGTANNAARVFSVKKGGSEVGTGNYNGTQTVAITEAGTYEIVFTGGEHKIDTISLTYN